MIKIVMFEVELPEGSTGEITGAEAETQMGDGHWIPLDPVPGSLVVMDAPRVEVRELTGVRWIYATPGDVSEAAAVQEAEGVAFIRWSGAYGAIAKDALNHAAALYIAARLCEQETDNER